MNRKSFIEDLGFGEGLVTGCLVVIGGFLIVALTGLPIDTKTEIKWWDLLIAVGTVGTFIVATYFAVRDARAKKSNEMVVAKLTAIGVKARMSKVALELSKLIECIEQDRKMLVESNWRNQIRSQLEKYLTVVDMDEVIRISRAEKSIAMDLMRANGDLRVVAIALGFRPVSKADDYSGTAKLLLEKLKRAQEAIDRAQRNCSVLAEWK